MTYLDFESILEPGNNGKRIPDEPYMNKYQKHDAYSYGYKFVFVWDKLSQPFKLKILFTILLII